MKLNYFIFSLPRSGTAWLSVFLSHRSSFCYHEPFADGGMSELEERAGQRPELCVGAIDTSAYRRVDEVRAERYYVVVRYPDEILRSLKQFPSAAGYNPLMEAKHLTAIHPTAVRIRYRDLGDVSYLHELWHEIVDLPFDRERAELLVEMNIQRSLPGVLERVRRSG